MKILYILTAMFPFGRAYPQRVLNLCRALRCEGHDVSIIADYISDKGMLVKDGEANYDGFQIFLSTKHSSDERTLLDKLLAPHRSKKTLNRYLNGHEVDIVITSSAFDRFFKWKRVIKRKHIPIILESCEWFDYYNFKFGKLDPRYYQFLHLWHNSHKSVDGAIGISRLITLSFNDASKPAIRIPAIADLDYFNKSKMLSKKKNHDKFKLVFIGEIVQGKDNLASVINAVLHSSTEDDFEFHVFGPTKDEIEKQLGKNIPSFVNAHGFIKQENLNEYLLDMDYGIIIRPNRRSSHAGFPTKLVEYMCMGLPVIANDTGDIKLFLKDGYNGYLIKNGKEKMVIDVLKRITKEHKSNYETLSKNALITAEESFDYHKYSSTLNNFINFVKNNGEKHF